MLLYLLNRTILMTTPISKSLMEDIQQRAAELGFDRCAFTPALLSDKDQAAYVDWCNSGGAADMEYMKRDPEKRLDVSRAFPGMKTILSLGVSYFQGPFPKKPGPAYGRVARYAWGLDYHEIIRDRLETLRKEIERMIGTSVNSTVAVDTKPLLERAFAASAGLGFVGKNTVFIAPAENLPRVARQGEVGFHVGSWVFLSEILLNIPFARHSSDGRSSDAFDKTAQGCGGCTKCLTACPTNALEDPYKLKSEKCISYLTIENKGSIPLEMRKKIGDWLYGCDICQDVCPFNARAKETRWPEFQADKGVGAWMLLEEIFSWSDQAAFKKKWGHTPLVRAKRKGLVRNACVVAGNSEDKSLIPALEALLADEEPLIREHANWALNELR
jgi:epoxyqueuosine reductase